MIPTEIDKAYTAGFFDGEGSIQITSPRVGKGHALQVSVAQADEPTIRGLAAAWGGSVFLHGRIGVWTWQITSKQAAAFLADIEPYLRLKRDQAQIAIRFQATKRLGRRLTPEYLAECELMRNSVRAMHGNIGRRAAVMQPNAA